MKKAETNAHNAHDSGPNFESIRFVGRIGLVICCYHDFCELYLLDGCWEYQIDFIKNNEFELLFSSRHVRKNLQVLVTHSIFLVVILLICALLGHGFL